MGLAWLPRVATRDGGLLPRLFTLARESVGGREVAVDAGGLFLWRFPSGLPAPPLAGILSGGARTFLSPCPPKTRL